MRYAEMPTHQDGNTANLPIVSSEKDIGEFEAREAVERKRREVKASLKEKRLEIRRAERAVDMEAAELAAREEKQRALKEFSRRYFYKSTAAFDTLTCAEENALADIFRKKSKSYLLNLPAAAGIMVASFYFFPFGGLLWFMLWIFGLSYLSWALSSLYNEKNFFDAEINWDYHLKFLLAEAVLKKLAQQRQKEGVEDG